MKRHRGRTLVSCEHADIIRSPWVNEGHPMRLYTVTCCKCLHSWLEIS